jgi:hypothetical protein
VDVGWVTAGAVLDLCDSISISIYFFRKAIRFTAKDTFFKLYPGHIFFILYTGASAFS